MEPSHWERLESIGYAALEQEPAGQAAFVLRRRSLPSCHPYIAAALNQHGWIAHVLGRSAEAELLLRRDASDSHARSTIAASCCRR